MFGDGVGSHGELSPIQTNCIKNFPKGKTCEFCFKEALERLLSEDNLYSFPANTIDTLVREAKRETVKKSSKSPMHSDAAVIASIYGPKRAVVFQIASRELLKRQDTLEPAELLKSISSDPARHLTLLDLIIAMIPKDEGKEESSSVEQGQREPQGIAKLISDDKTVTGIDWSLVKDSGLLTVRTWARTAHFFSQMKALKKTAEALIKAADYYTAPEGTLPVYWSSLNSLIQNSVYLKPLLKVLVDWVNIYNAKYAKTFQPVAGFKSAALGDGLRLPILKKRLVDVFVQEKHLPKVLSKEHLGALLRDCNILKHTKQVEIAAEGSSIVKELGVAMSKLASISAAIESRSILDNLDGLKGRLEDSRTVITNELSVFDLRTQELRAMFMEDPNVGVDEIARNLQAFLQRLNDGQSRQKLTSHQAPSSTAEHFEDMTRQQGGRHEIVLEVDDFK